MPRQVLLYVVAGGAAAAAHLAVLTFLVELAGVYKTLASAIGFTCAVPVNYLLQHRFVFLRRGGHRGFFSRYIGVTLAALGLNAVLFWLLVEVVHLHYIVAQIIAIAIVFALNFLANRSFTFRERAGPGDAG